MCKNQAFKSGQFTFHLDLQQMHSFIDIKSLIIHGLRDLSIYFRAFSHGMSVKKAAEMPLSEKTLLTVYCK